MGNATLITLGVLGGFYLLFTIGWIIGGFRLQGRAEYLVTDVMFQGSFWLAVLAPALWFGTVFLLTRGSAGWVRIVWLVAGAILLVPWPFIMVGAVGTMSERRRMPRHPPLGRTPPGSSPRSQAGSGCSTPTPCGMRSAT